MTRRCVSCGDTKSTDSFHKNRRAPDGCASECAECRNRRHREKYRRQKKPHDPIEALAAARLAESRFWTKVNRDGPVPSHVPNIGRCWVWMGSSTGSNNSNLRYGNFCVAHRMPRAHQVSWALANGRWPDKWVLHRCDNSLCVRPEHLYLGDRAQNTLDRVKRDRSASRVKTADVEEMLRLASEGWGISALMERFRLSRGQTRDILKGTAWPHIARPKAKHKPAPALTDEVPRAR